ncbi:MAG TPA: ADP-ribosylglycohydrolase family protein [Tepidisphaeraceae bacterium]|nr:ADP-ribosylglycohydrolase family protein [Tepidisphaeraceae bacterium]
MLIELAIADAYGAGFEYVKDEIVRTRNTLAGYVQHPRHPLPPGSYTDDTQMSIAVAEVLVEGLPWTPEVLAERFVTAFKRDPRNGYAQGFYHFLQSVTGGADFLARIKPDSDKSGGAMRAAPVGVLPTIAEVIDYAARQAALTHDTPDGRNAAAAAALMSHYFLYRLGPRRDLGHFVAAHVPGAWAEPYVGKVKETGWMSVQAAVTAVVASDRMSDLLRRCVDFTGDVDTVAAIACAAASASDEVEQDLPRHLFDGLENGPYGRDYLIDLDRRLLALVRR